MRKLRAACLPLLGGLLTTCLTPLAMAQPRGADTTGGSAPPTAAPSKASPTSGASAGATEKAPKKQATKKRRAGGKKSTARRTKRGRKPSKTSARRGRRPKPKPRAPGSKPGKPDDGARKMLTGRHPKHSTAAPAESPELKAMRELDHELFPPVPAPYTAPWATSLELPTSAPQVSASGLPASGQPSAQAKAAPQADLSWIAKLKKPDFPVRFEPSVVRYLTYYKTTTRGRAKVARWVQKSGRYRKAITKLLRHYQMPEDVLWLALVESAFEPTIHSHAGAAGLWQFMPATGRVYGLTVNRRVDERLDPERSTHAALRHLKDLNQRFGSWELAFAAYNMGYGGLLSSIRKFNTNDYWELRRLEAGLPYETALYVPKIMAMAIAAKNCDVFGCQGVKLDDPRPFGDTKADRVSVAPGVTLTDVARAIGDKAGAVAELNPHVIGSRLPPLEPATGSRRSWTVYVPEGKGKRASGKVPRTGVARKLATHRTRWGEPLARIAAAYDTTVTKLRRLNDLHAHESPRPDTVIFVPAGRKPKSTTAATAKAPVAVVPDHDFRYSDRRRVFYEPVLGDRLEDVARICGVTAAELRRWNHLDPGAALQQGMRLQLFIAQSSKPAGVVLHEESQVRTVTVESLPFFDHFVQSRGRKRIEVTARAGDTWKKLGKRFGLSLGMLERINHLSRRSKLAPGQKVIVYARKGLVKPAKSPTAESKDKPVDEPAKEAPDSRSAGTPETGQPPPGMAANPAKSASARR
jgi:membrane-bound lytic murein transglycosylase D